MPALQVPVLSFIVYNGLCIVGCADLIGFIQKYFLNLFQESVRISVNHLHFLIEKFVFSGVGVCFPQVFYGANFRVNITISFHIVPAFYFNVFHP